MSSRIGLGPEQLRTISVLRDFSDEELRRIAERFRPIKVQDGDVLFQTGDEARDFFVLVGGEVVLIEEDKEAYRLHPTAIVGELGALTGLRRQCKAVVGEGAELWALDGTALRQFFDASPALGLRFQHALLSIAAHKIERDQVRISEMRENIVRTQKAMKRMRDLLLESPDTPVSAPIHDTLERLIERNRRVNYRVEPPEEMPASVRFDDGVERPIVQISRTHFSYELPEGQLPQVSSSIACVLNLAGPEVAASGKVLRHLGRRVDVALDMLIDEYAVLLEGYLTRVQMLDYLV